MTTYARVLFPGIDRVESCRLSFGHGITPTGFQLTLGPQPPGRVLTVGTLRLEYNDQSLEFPGCRADRAYFNLDGRGRLIELTIHDRRWQWQYGFLAGVDNGRINGEYNARRADGTIRKIENGDKALAVEDSERTPEQLFRLLFTAAGEPIAADAFADLPNDVRPYVNWDSANPYVEMQALAEQLNCRVVLGFDSQVRIKRVNVGAELNYSRVKSYGDNANLFAGPDRVSLVTGWTRYQHDFELEDCGLDVDGNWKRLDKLSYKPAGGWENSDVFSRFGLIDEAPTQNLAIETVFRSYRIKVPFELPGWGIVSRREQLILLGTQIFQANIDGEKVDRPAMVYGVWYRAVDAAPDNSISAIRYLPDNAVEALRADDPRVSQIVRVNFSTDHEACIVRFTEPVWMQDTVSVNGPWIPAKLRLRASCYVKRLEDARIQRYEFGRDLRQSDNPVIQYLNHDDIKPHVWAIYDDSFGVKELKTNEVQTRPEIERYLDEAQRIYATPEVPQAAVYGGWKFDLPLDGAIQSITWTLNRGEVATRIERNHDSGEYAIPYKNLAEWQRVARSRREVARAEWRAAREKEISRANNRGPA